MLASQGPTMTRGTHRDSGGQPVICWDRSRRECPVVADAVPSRNIRRNKHLAHESSGVTSQVGHRWGEGSRIPCQPLRFIVTVVLFRERC
ncbi:MAG: hypothetical protein KatS3mg111_2410 [Pirellulaceae bacterium]|nr:MAG: hypothetical protein KatS3mg111_2410 [Pirellulaceae bacterium]